MFLLKPKYPLHFLKYTKHFTLTLIRNTTSNLERFPTRPTVPQTREKSLKKYRGKLTKRGVCAIAMLPPHGKF